MRIVKIFVAAAIPFALLGCPDSAKPDPAAADGGATAAKAAAPGVSASAAAPAKSGGW
jgi:hypothetical protein